MKNTIPKILFILVLLLTVVSAADLAYAASLEDYPNVFTQRASDRPFIVVGENAPAQDVVTASEVAVSLQRELLRTHRRKLYTAKLDAEVPDVARNLVVVGAAQDNNVIGRILGTNNENPFNLHPGEALVILLEHGGHYQLVITGYTSREVAKAGDLVAQYQTYQALFRDREIRIQNGRIRTPSLPRGVNSNLLNVADSIRRVSLTNVNLPRRAVQPQEQPPSLPRRSLANFAGISNTSGISGTSLSTDSTISGFDTVVDTTTTVDSTTGTIMTNPTSATGSQLPLTTNRFDITEPTTSTSNAVSDEIVVVRNIAATNIGLPGRRLDVSQPARIQNQHLLPQSTSRTYVIG